MSLTRNVEECQSEMEEKNKENWPHQHVIRIEERERERERDQMKILNKVSLSPGKLIRGAIFLTIHIFSLPKVYDFWNFIFFSNSLHLCEPSSPTRSHFRRRFIRVACLILSLYIFMMFPALATWKGKNFTVPRIGDRAQSLRCLVYGWTSGPLWLRSGL